MPYIGSLGKNWRRRPGRPRVRWTDQLRNDTGSVPANLWRQAILMVEWRDSPSWLRDDDNDDDDESAISVKSSNIMSNYKLSPELTHHNHKQSM